MIISAFSAFFALCLMDIFFKKLIKLQTNQDDLSYVEIIINFILCSLGVFSSAKIFLIAVLVLHFFEVDMKWPIFFYFLFFAYNTLLLFNAEKLVKK